MTHITKQMLFKENLNKLVSDTNYHELFG